MSSRNTTFSLHPEVVPEPGLVQQLQDLALSLSIFLYKRGAIRDTDDALQPLIAADRRR